MKKSVFTELLLYRYRYQVGYALFVLAVFDLLLIAGTSIPGALTQAEMHSAVASATIPMGDILKLPIIDLPYHLLQKASIALFGLSPFAIKLPSLLLGLASGITFMFLLRRWFTRSVAIITAIIAVTASQFLIVSQSGTPTIMLLFWPTFMLFTATGISMAQRFRFAWKLLFFALAALSLYTPLSIYILIVMLVAAFLHPHLRFMVRRLSKLKLAVCLVVASILLVPLGIHIVQAPLSTVAALLGIPSEWPTFASLWENLKTMAHAFAGFTAPAIGAELMFPLYGISTSALVLLGILRLGADHHSARTYTIGLWSLAMTIILLLQPLQFIAISFVPMLLMLAIGIDTLIREWYDLFPLNPYARAAALVPLIILMSTIVYSGVNRYTNSYRYSPQVAQYFNTDLTLLRRELLQLPGNKTIVVSAANQPFYELLHRRHPEITVTSQPTSASTLIVAGDMVKDTKKVRVPAKVLTNAYTNDNVRFLIYKTDEKMVQ